MKEKLYSIFICFLSFSTTQGQKNNSIKDSLYIIELNDLAYDFLFTNIDSSFFYAKKQLKFSIENKSKALIASSYSMLSSVYMYKNNLDSSLFYIKESLKISQATNNQKSIGKNYMNLALIYDKLNYNDSSFMAYKKSLTIFKEINDSNEISMTYLNLGSLVLSKFQKPDSAILLFQKAEDFSENNLRIKNAVYQNLGVIFKNKGLTAKALSYYLKSLKLLKDSKDELFKLPLYLNISSIYIKEHNFDKAREYIKKCNKLSLKMNFEEGVCRSTLQEGILLLEMNRNDSAYLNFNLAVSLAQTQNVFDVKRDAYHYLALINLLTYETITNSKIDDYSNNIMYKYEDSIYYYLNLSQKHNLNSKISKTGLQNSILEAKVLELKNRNIQALEIYKGVYNKANKNNWINLQLETSQNISSLLEEASFYKEALEWRKKSNKLNDSIFNLRNENQLEAIKYKLEKNIEVIKLKDLANQKEIIHQKEITKNLITGFILIIVIFLLLIYTFVINLKRKNQAVKDINSQKKIIEMELLILRTQMNPHFLFNTIQSIQSYILQNDAKNSYQYLTKFSSLLRSTINNSKLSSIPVSEEVEIISNYLELEQMRLDNKFDFKISCDESIINSNVKIQPMLIQPLVENAIVHGFDKIEYKGLIQISLKRETDFVIVEVEDNGIGRTKGSLKTSKHKSVAINNIKERLSVFEGASLTYIDKFENRLPSGTIVKIRAKIF